MYVHKDIMIKLYYKDFHLLEHFIALNNYLYDKRYFLLKHCKLSVI